MEQIFQVVLVDDKYRIAIGKQIMSVKEFSSIDEAEEYINDKPWELIANLQLIVAHNLWTKSINEKNEANEKNS